MDRKNKDFTKNRKRIFHSSKSQSEMQEFQDGNIKLTGGVDVSPGQLRGKHCASLHFSCRDRHESVTMDEHLHHVLNLRT